MTFRNKTALVWAFFSFNMRVMAPGMLRLGWKSVKTGVSLMFSGITLPIRGIFHSRMIFQAVAETEDRLKDAALSYLDEIALSEETQRNLDRAAKDPNVN
jgi:hypothetical protein